MAWIETYTGGTIHFSDGFVRTEDISIEDIAQSLSMMCRFNGHIKEFYSVAEHSLLVSSEAPEKIKLEALLHDAAEAYVADLVRPIKRHVGKEYADLEYIFLCAICRKFKLVEELIVPELSESIKLLDDRALVTERQQLKLNHRNSWGDYLDNLKPLNVRLECWSPREAKERFLDEFWFWYGNRYNKGGWRNIEQGETE